MFVSELVPSRFDEGYGFSVRAAREAARDGVGLVVTADIGVRDHAAVAAAREAGVVLLTVLVGQTILGWHNDIVDRQRDQAHGLTGKPLAVAFVRDWCRGAVAVGVVVVVASGCLMAQTPPQPPPAGGFNGPRGVAVDPRNAEAMTNLGICAACTGSPAVGLKLMQQAVSLRPDNPD